MHCAVCVCVRGRGEKRRREGGGEKREGGKEGEDIFHCFYSSPFSSLSVFLL